MANEVVHEPLLPPRRQDASRTERSAWPLFGGKHTGADPFRSTESRASYDSLDLLEQQSQQSLSSSAARQVASTGASITKGLMHSKAAQKFQQLSASYKSRRQLERDEDVELPRWVVHPHDIVAQCWWTFILCTVVMTLFLEPWNICFSQYPGLYPLSAPDTVFAIAYFFIYASDVLLNFFVAYYQDGELVTDLGSIARNYAHGRLWADLVTTIPFDWIVLEAMGLQRSNSTLAWYISLLRLLRLGRAYRLYGWVKLMTYNQTLSLMAVTLTRNFALCFFTVHWGACGFYYIAKQSGFSEMTWVGANMDWVGLGTAFDKWTYSMYWSIITFSTVGYGDLHAYSVAEAFYVVLYMFVSIGVAAYFVGTSVLLVVENEKKTGAYRESLIVLDDYTATHAIPKPLRKDMKGHLQLHFSSAESSDEAVLAVYPTTIRRRILRHLYNQPLHSCWLFVGCKQKFIDALLLAAKVELYMPKVDIVSAGDLVNELHLILAGHATAERGNAADTLLAADGATSVHGASMRVLGVGNTCGEMAFFTETPCLEHVRTTGVCRVMTVPRVLYNTLAADFPVSARAVMDNLVARAEEMIQREFPGPNAAKIMDSLDNLAALELKYASPEILSGATVGASPSAHGSEPGVGGSKDNSANVSRQNSFTGVLASGWRTPPLSASLAIHNGASSATSTPLPLDPSGLPMRQGQQQVLANLLRVLALAKQSHAKLDQQRTHMFLNACASGHVDRVKLMLQQGYDVNCCDYDGRTGLMLSATAGHVLVVKLLLVAGATVNMLDHTGSCALLDACKAGHDGVIEVLLQAGCTVTLPAEKSAGLLCAAVHSGDMQLLRRLLRAGVDADAEDYDKRTALHIAAADGNLLAVKLLIESAQANSSLADRWDHTALDEAWRVGAMPVVEFLNSKLPGGRLRNSRHEFQLRQAQSLLLAASKGQEEAVQRILDKGCPPDACDYYGHTALMIAASKGHQAIMKILLNAGANVNTRDHSGNNALLNAIEAGHDGILMDLVSAGATLPLSRQELSRALCNAVFNNDVNLVRRFIQAGADVNVTDYNMQTALHVAAAEGKLDMVDILCRQGTCIITKDRWEATPIGIAEKAQHQPIVDYLTRYAIGQR